MKVWAWKDLNRGHDFKFEVALQTKGSSGIWKEKSLTEEFVS